MKTLIHNITKICVVLGLLGATIFTLKLDHAQSQTTTSDAGFKVFTDSVTPLPKPDEPGSEAGFRAHGLIAGTLEPEHRNEKMELLFSLSIPKDSEARLQESIEKGEAIPPKDLEEKYSPKKADLDALVAWLKGHGFEIAHISRDRTSVYAKTTVGQIEKSLQVQMVRVVKGGITYTAARNAPKLPADVGAGVRAIIGLQPFRQAHRHNRKVPYHNDDPALARRAAAGGSTVTPAIANAPPYLVKEVLKAYNADNLPVTGAGQKIAILIDTFPVDSDLQEFWKRNGLAVTLGQVEKINVKAGQPPAQEGEETLDVEWTTGIAPGATVRVYASGSLAFVDLDKALDGILADLQSEPGMRQLSISLGLGETCMGGPQGEVAVQHQKFLQLAAAGVNVFVSSGDAGSNPDCTGHSSSGLTQVEYESSDSSVIGVGGTRLNIDQATGQVSNEVAWPGSGGGKSIFFPRPKWQKGPGVPPGKKRLVPDVSLAADPDRGAFVFFQGQDQQIGGTSWSAPVWAGFCALINESRVKAGKPPLPYLPPLVYVLNGSASFRDITIGSNGQYKAGRGYDMVTGIGVPDMEALVTALTK